jgi:nucleoid-associated protein YgaU
MTGNSFNLVDSIRGYLSDTFTNRLSLLLGESHEKTQTGLHAAVPSILSAFDTASTTPDGSRRLATAIDDSDDSVLDNFSTIFGKDFSSDSQIGTLRSLMGGGFSDLTSNLGRMSGLSLRSVTSLLGVLLPVVFGVIKRTLRSRSMRSADIGSFLAGQRSNIAAALPAGVSPRFTEEKYTGTRERTRREEVVETKSESNVGKWALPLAGLLAALGLMWYLASRPGPTVREARTTTIDRSTGVPAVDLTTKYQSVINTARAQGVELSSVRQHDGKLMLKGTAPSQEAANKVWEEIRRVDPRQRDIVADFSVKSASAMTTTEKDKVASHDEDKTIIRDKPVDRAKPADDDKQLTDSGSVSRTYTVKAGDTLGSISKQFYGTTGDYKKIFEANRDRITNPDVITVGQELTIP